MSATDWVLSDTIICVRTSAVALQFVRARALIEVATNVQGTLIDSFAWTMKGF